MSRRPEDRPSGDHGSDADGGAAQERPADVSITASVRATELRARSPSRVRVTFRGKGRVVTRRVGLPPTGAVPGVTHRNVTITTTIEARARAERPEARGASPKSERKKRA